MKIKAIEKPGIKYSDILIILTIITIAISFSSWLMFSTFSYDTKTDSMRLASKVWSDFGAHIPLIRSFSMGDNLNNILQGQLPEYPIFPGEPIRYHFIFYMVVGILEKIGFRIDWALNLPSVLGFAGLLIGVYLLSLKLTKSILVSLLSIIFLIFNGSLTFIKFFNDRQLNLKTIIEFTQNREFLSFAPWGQGDISAFWTLNIYTNQRHLAFGFAIVIWFILTFVHIENKPKKNQLPFVILWALIIGSLPYFHQPALIMLAIFMACYLILFPKNWWFLITTGLMGSVFIIPQLLTFAHGSNYLAFKPGYLIEGKITLIRFVLYWWHNIGLHLFLIPIGFIFISNKIKKIVLPVFIIFILANLFQISREMAANHKFINFFMIMGNIITAFTIFSIYKLINKSNNIFLKIISFTLLSAICCLLILSGILDFFAVKNDRKGFIKDINSDPQVQYFAANTPIDSVVLNAYYLYHPASLAGRKIYLGWPYFSWSAGYDVDSRFENMKQMYEIRDHSQFCRLLKVSNISFINIVDTKDDKDLPMIDSSYFLSNYKPDYVDPKKNFFVYRTDSICRN